MISRARRGGREGGNKNGQQKKGAGIKRQRGWNDCKKYQLYEGCAATAEHDDLNSDNLMHHEHAFKTRKDKIYGNEDVLKCG